MILILQMLCSDSDLKLVKFPVHVNVKSNGASLRNLQKSRRCLFYTSPCPSPSSSPIIQAFNKVSNLCRKRAGSQNFPEDLHETGIVCKLPLLKFTPAFLKDAKFYDPFNYPFLGRELVLLGSLKPLQTSLN